MTSLVPKPTGRKRHMWCGPYALAVCLGLDYDDALELARRVTRRKRVKGMYSWEVLRSLKRHKVRTKFQPLWEHAGVKSNSYLTKRTMRSCLDYLKPNRLYIVNVTGHYVVLDTSDGTAIDNWTGGWFPVDRHHSALARVSTVAEVKRTGNDDNRRELE